MRALLLIVLAVAAIGAAAAANFALESLQAQPAAQCPPVQVDRERVGNTTIWRVVTARGGLHPLVDTWYRLPTLGWGNLRDASVGYGGLPLRYVDASEPADAISPGDLLVVVGEELHELDLVTGSGERLGGTGCDAFFMMPGPGCGPNIGLDIQRSSEETVVVIERTELGPHPIEHLRYRIILNDDDRTVFAEGGLAEAMGRNASGLVAYKDLTPPHDEVNPGDRLLVRTSEGFNMELIGPSGYRVGGTWMCI